MVKICKLRTCSRHSSMKWSSLSATKFIFKPTISSDPSRKHMSAAFCLIIALHNIKKSSIAWGSFGTSVWMSKKISFHYGIKFTFVDEPQTVSYRTLGMLAHLDKSIRLTSPMRLRISIQSNLRYDTRQGYHCSHLLLWMYAKLSDIRLKTDVSIVIQSFLPSLFELFTDCETNSHRTVKLRCVTVDWFWQVNSVFWQHTSIYNAFVPFIAQFILISYRTPTNRSKARWR